MLLQSGCLWTATMKIRFGRFNIYLLTGGLLAGCASTKSDPEKAGVNEMASLRLHMEVNSDGSDKNSPVLIGRSIPFLVNVEKQPFLTEYKIVNASLVEELGAFMISVEFDKEGTWLLEHYTTSYRGKRIGVAAIFGESQSARWLGAPRITETITNGVFIFTPDASRKEADRIVAGLNNFALKEKEGKR